MNFATISLTLIDFDGTETVKVINEQELSGVTIIVRENGKHYVYKHELLGNSPEHKAIFHECAAPTAYTLL